MCNEHGDNVSHAFNAQTCFVGQEPEPGSSAGLLLPAQSST